jgi:hypothetical protein
VTTATSTGTAFGHIAHAKTPLDPREGRLLADRDDGVVAREGLQGSAGRHQQTAPVLVDRPDRLEHHGRETAAVHDELLGHQTVMNGDALAPNIVLLPGRRLHLGERRAGNDRHASAAQAPRRARTIHRGVAAADYHHALADAADVAEPDVGEPFHADVDVCGGGDAAGKIEVEPARRAGADEHGIRPLCEQRLEAPDIRGAAELDAEVEDVADLLVNYSLGHAEMRDAGAHHAAGHRISVEDDAAVTERRQVTGDGKGRRAAVHEGDALAVPAGGELRQERADLALVIGRGTLQAADRHRLLLHPAAAAGGLARPIAGATQDAGEDIGLPVDHVGLGVTAFRDQPDVVRYRSVGGTSPLTVHDVVEVVRLRDVSGLHGWPSLRDFSQSTRCADTLRRDPQM